DRRGDLGSAQSARQADGAHRVGTQRAVPADLQPADRRIVAGVAGGLGTADLAPRAEERESGERAAADARPGPEKRRGGAAADAGRVAAAQGAADPHALPAALQE